VKSYGRFGFTETSVTLHLHLGLLALHMKVIDQSTGQNVPHDLNLHQHRCENVTTTNCCPETSARNYQSMLPKILEERRSHLHSVRSPKSRNCGSVTFSAISRAFCLLCWSRICWSFQIYEYYLTTGKEQEEIG